MDPTLSVIIPNYNHGRYLKTLIPMLLSQSRPPDEIVIVDDGSTDDSIAIIEQFKSPRIRLFKNEKNRGVLYTLNFAVAQATGTYLTFPSADNLVQPGFYEKSLALLTQHPEAAICCTDPLYLVEKTQVTYARPLKLSDVSRFFTAKEAVELCRTKNFCIGNLSHTVVVKKSALKEFGKGEEFFVKDLHWHCDFFVWNAIAFRYGVCYIPEGLAIFREEEGGYSQVSVPWEKRISVYRALLNKIGENKDIRSAFKRSGILKEFRESMLVTLLATPRHYHYFTPRLTFNLIRGSARGLIRSIPYAHKTYRFLKKVFQ